MITISTVLTIVRLVNSKKKRRNMLKFTVLAILLAAACAVPVEPQESELPMIVVENLEEYLFANPEVKILAELKKEVNEPFVDIKYTLGNRQRGDRLVSTSNANNQWPRPQDVSARIIYPTNGVGSIVTYVEVLVGQSSNVGAARVVSGGIGQRSIQVLIEAKQTLFYRHTGQIYGIN